MTTGRRWCPNRSFPVDSAALGNLIFFPSHFADYLYQNTMARRTRNSRAWHFVLNGVRRDADARAVALASGAHGWGYDSDGQVGWNIKDPKVKTCFRRGYF